MAASSIPSRPWITQVWRPPILGLNEGATSCHYCGNSSPPMKCSSCPTAFCNATCQEKSISTHKYICEGGSLEALISKLTSLKSLSSGLSLCCLTQDFIERVSDKAAASDIDVDICFANFYDAVRSTGVSCEPVQGEKWTIFDGSMETCGRLYINDSPESRDLGSRRIVICDSVTTPLLSESSILFFAMLSFAFNHERNKISGEMMAMHTFMYEGIMSEDCYAPPTLIGISPSMTKDEKDYTMIRMGTAFIAREMLDPNKEACCVYAFHLHAPNIILQEDALPEDDLSDERSHFEPHMFFLFEEEMRNVEKLMKQLKLDTPSFLRMHQMLLSLATTNLARL